MYMYQNNNGTVPMYGTVPITTNFGYNQSNQQGYYNQYNNMGGYYNNIYDPYNQVYYEDQIMEERRRLEEEQKNQLEIERLVHRMAEGFNGEKIESYLDYEDDTDYAEQVNRISAIQNETYEYNRLSINVRNRTIQGKDYVGDVYKSFVNHINAVRDKYYKDFQNKDMDLYEFFDKSYVLLKRINDDEIKKFQLNLRATYDSDRYHELITIHNNAKYNSLSPMVNIDDMEVELPDRFRSNTVYQKKKAEFFNYLIEKSVRIGGV